MPCSDSLTSVSLILSGSSWHIQAGDADAAYVVTSLSEVMSLPPVNLPAKQCAGEQWQKLLVVVGHGSGGTPIDDFESGPVFCFLPPPKNHDLLVIGMLLISHAIAHAELLRGGLLVHGALATNPGHLEGGIILAGPSAVGKTTASNRLPLPWRSLSDDTSLVVRDDRGQYMAHPWPTWSRFYSTREGNPGLGGKWEVQTGLPLQAFFFLAQAEKDRIVPLPTAPAVAYLMQTVQHVSLPMHSNMSAHQDQTLHENQLAAAEKLVRTIPVYTLHLSLTGTFWEGIEKTLASVSIPSFSQPEHTPSHGTGQEYKKSTSPPFLFGGNRLAVKYTGSSMNPTLRHPDLIEVIPYAGKPIRCGDVVYYEPSTGGPKVIHRVVRVTAKGICTRGDNNCENDPYLLQPSDVIGQVKAAWRSDKRRIITGGTFGIWSGYRAKICDRLNKILSPTLHGIYHGISANGFLLYLLPASKQPRIVEFKQRYQPSILKLMVNGHVIGRYDVWRKLWVIDRPWRLIIDERKLPVVAESPSREPTDVNNAAMENTAAHN